MNLYAHVRGNPIRLRDPRGTNGVDATGADNTKKKDAAKAADVAKAADTLSKDEKTVIKLAKQVGADQAQLKAGLAKFVDAFYKSGPAVDKAEKAIQAEQAKLDKDTDALNTAQDKVNEDKEKLLALITVDKGQPQEAPQQTAGAQPPTDQKPPNTATPDANKTASEQEPQKTPTTPPSPAQKESPFKPFVPKLTITGAYQPQKLWPSSPRRAHHHRSRAISSARGLI